jgi:hypothetical protein
LLFLQKTLESAEKETTELTMTTINTANTGTTYTPNTSSGASSSAVANSGETSESTANQDTLSKSSVALSDRATKIQKLNEEFFPGGPQTIRITPDFISRLQEYGLISASDAERLGEVKGLAEDSSANSLEKLSLFAEEFGNKLKEEDPDNSLIGTLEKATAKLNSWENNSVSTVGDVKEIIAKLADFIDSEEAKALTQSEKDSLLQLEFSMIVADKLSPEGNISGKINKYLDVFNQSTFK